MANGNKRKRKGKDEIEETRLVKAKTQEEHEEEFDQEAFEQKRKELFQQKLKENVEKLKCTPDATKLYKLICESPTLKHSVKKENSTYRYLLFNLCDFEKMYKHLKSMNSKEEETAKTLEEYKTQTKIFSVTSMYNMCDVYPLELGAIDSHPLQRATYHVGMWFHDCDKVIQNPLLLQIHASNPKLCHFITQKKACGASLSRLVQIAQMIVYNPSKRKRVQELVEETYIAAYNNEIKDSDKVYILREASFGSFTNIELLLTELVCYLSDAVFSNKASHKQLLTENSAGMFRKRIMQTCLNYMDIHHTARAAIDCSHPHILFVCLSSPTYISIALRGYIKLMNEGHMKEFAPASVVHEWKQIYFYYPSNDTWSPWEKTEEVMQQVELLLSDLENCKAKPMESITTWDCDQNISVIYKDQIRELMIREDISKTYRMYKLSLYDQIQNKF